MHRTVEFCEDSLTFVQEVNQMVTRLLAAAGSTKVIPQEESDPKVEAAAVMLAANLLALTQGDWPALRDNVWPRAAQGNLRQFEAHLAHARREEQRHG